MIRSAPQAASNGRAHETLARADMAIRMGNVREAERLAAGVLKADKGNLAAATILAQSLMMLGRSTEAIPVLERATHRHRDPMARTLLATALAAAGRGDDALAQLQDITARDVAFPPAFREHASQHARLGQIDAAIAVILRGVALSPEAIELRIDLAALHLRRNERAAARAVLIGARDLAPGRRDVLCELARVMLLDGDYAAAADAYRHALALQPDDAMTRSNLAACQLELGQREAGEASLRTAVKSGPHILGRAIYALAASSHGRFFLRRDRAAAFLRGDKS